MEMQTEDASISTMKEIRSQLESRVETQHNNLIDVLNSFQSIIPSIDLSRKIVSSFNNKPFVPTPVIQRQEKPVEPNRSTFSESKPSMPKTERLIIDDTEECENMAVDEGNKSPLTVVRSIVAMCLLERVPFVAIDSSTVLRKLENDESLKAGQKAALRDLGGESGAIHAVEMALRSIAEDNGGVELEEFVVSGKSRVMILGIDRNQVMKELAEGKLRELSSGDRDKDRARDRNSGGDKVGGGVDVNGKVFGMVGSVGRQVPDMWLQPFGPAGAVMGGPGSAPRMMGMMGMPRGMGLPQLHRPFLGPNASIGSPHAMPQKVRSEEDDLKDLEALLNKKSFKEMQQSRTGEELLDLIHRPTAKETAVAAKFKTKGGSQVKEYCSALTKEDCRRQSGSYLACEKVHFRRIIAPHTDVNLGDCSFLDTCRHMKTCKYVHYELDTTPDVTPMVMGANALAPPKFIKPQHPDYCSEVELGEPQWINCDIRSFRMDILGQFGVIMADPPWDIHMELPYGTMADDEMRNLNVPALQTDGLIFLWVTGRAMELGRECLEQWGYKRIEEIIWVKTNQLQRIIRTGRTGHWLNHSKEHCLVGIKGNPIVNRNIDTDVIVAEVRETSRKPDEMYPMLERISPRTRKLELFARMHNTQAGWMSLGNQLNGVRLVDEGLRARFKAAYPDVEVQPSSPPRTSAMEIDSSSSQMRNSYAVTESKGGSTQFAETVAQVQPYASEEKPKSSDSNMAG